MLDKAVFAAAFAVLLASAAPVEAQNVGAQNQGAQVQDIDAPIVTGVRSPERVDELRLREAIAYSNALPRGAPTEDYPLVAWCEALVTGHVALGETLNSTDPLDVDLIRLGRLEAQDFRSALAAGERRQTVETLAAARHAAEAGQAQWAPLLANEDVAVRSQAFGLFFGLPGRCEHAARRIRDNITTPPATPEEVGLD